MEIKSIHRSLSYVLVLTFILMGCRDQIVPSRPDNLSENYYQSLRDQNPDSLSYDKLYDRTLGLLEIPFEELDCQTKYGKAHVLIAGPKDGEPLVLLHGMNASSTSWYPNISSFAKTRRVYAIDFILEVNKSEMTSKPDGTGEVLNWYNEVFSCLELEKFDLLGASRGGWLATMLAIDNPSRISKLMLLSPAQTFVWIPPSEKMIRNIMYTLSPSREDLKEALSALSYNVEGIDQLYIDQYYKASVQSEIDASIFDMKPFSDEELAQLNMPVLVMIGDEDFVNKDKSLTLAEEKIKKVNTELVKKAGHFLSIDQAELVNAKVTEFLNENE